MNNSPSSLPEKASAKQPTGVESAQALTADMALAGQERDALPKENPADLPPEKRVYTKAQRLLVPIALLIGLLYDRLILAVPGGSWLDIPFFSGIFWLCYLVVFYALNWERLKKDRAMWFVAGAAGALCVWNFVFDYRSSFGGLSLLVIPAVLMAHARYTAGNFTLKQTGALAIEWLAGWFVKPFSAIPLFFEALAGNKGEEEKKSKNSTLKRVLLGLLLALPILVVVLPLLAGADQMFARILENIRFHFNFTSVVSHLITTALATLLFFSFLWNVRFNRVPPVAAKKERRLDAVACGVALGIVTALYALFCVIQFTYLFAGAGLPDGVSYSAYARQGFWQLIVVAGINVSLFGLFLRYTEKHSVIRGLLAALLVLTGFMLVSAVLRLRLYIQSYGMTWLRLLSAWFIVYLAVVLVLCAVRMLKEKLPLMALCAFILLGWFVVLGYSNPEALIIRSNLAHWEVNQWMEENEYFVDGFSDDSILALMEGGIAEEKLSRVMLFYPRGEGYSFSSLKMRKALEPKE